MATLSASSRTCSTSVARRSAVPQALAPRAPTRPSRAAAVRVQAVKVQPPQGVTLPPQEPQVPPAMFGFVDWAEKINGRAAMIGFFALLAVEAIAHKGILELAGLKIGGGLGFEL